jgi:D-apionate oxidoisomerase
LTGIKRAPDFHPHRLSPIGHRLSPIGYRPSAIGHRLSAIGHRPSAIGYRLSAIGYHFISTCLLFQVHYQAKHNRNLSDHMTTVTLLGAGGKMGCRIVDHLQQHPDYTLCCVETAEGGLANLAARGCSAVPCEDALVDTDVAILALPDRILGQVARDVVPRLKPGAMIFTLDPAAAHAGELPDRPDISIFVSHPCHPDVFDHFESEIERDDFFGGTHARQAIVCALMRGPEAHYALGEKLARSIYAPVTRAHRITVEQMAILEPAMAETVGICLVMALREALEEAVRQGVPRAAAEDFMYGHVKVELGIAFSRVNFPFSDGAKLIAEYGRQHLLKPDWRKLFEPDSVKAQVKTIVTGTLPPASP